MMIGYLTVLSREASSHYVTAIKEGLAVLGWSENQNYVFEARWADGYYDRLPLLAAELAAKKPAIIIAGPSPAIVAMAKAAPETPIVVASGDPLAAGLVSNLARPGGMITGVTNIVTQVNVKLAELLNDAIPKLRRIGFLVDANNLNRVAMTEAARRAVMQHSIDGRFTEVEGPERIEPAIARLAKEGAQALVIMSGPLFLSERHRIIKLAADHRWPSIGGQSEYAEAGALLSYGADRMALYRRTVYYVDKILKGTKPGDIPIEQPTKFELVVNMRTAKALGLKMPHHTCAGDQGDRVMRKIGQRVAGLRRRGGTDATYRSTRRALLIALGAGAITAPFSSFAQPATKVYRIGILSSEHAAGYATRLEALRAGLRDLGYVEGRNITFEFRWADGKYERLPELAAELVRLKPDVLVTFANQAAQAAKRASTTIPIVIPSTGDAVDTGLITSLARPGGNITGSTHFGRELIAKRLELLKEAAPRIARVACLVNPTEKSSEPTLRALEVAAKSLKLEVQSFAISKHNEFESAFATMAKRRVDAIVLNEQPIFIVNAKTIMNLAAKQRLPSSGFTEIADAGGLIGYGVNFPDLYRRAAYFVDRILKGANPGDLPVEQPSRFDFAVNLKTARALGIKVPNSILVRATKVIE